MVDMVVAGKSVPANTLTRTRMSRAPSSLRGNIGDMIRIQWLKLTSTLLRSDCCRLLPANVRWPFPDGPIPRDGDLFWCRHRADNGLVSLIFRAHLADSTCLFVLWEKSGPTGLPIRYEWLSGLQPDAIRSIMGDRFEVEYPEVLRALNLLVLKGQCFLTKEDGSLVATKLPFHSNGLGG